jgi:hypothetical protein
MNQESGAKSQESRFRSQEFVLNLIHGTTIYKHQQFLSCNREAIQVLLFFFLSWLLVPDSWFYIFLFNASLSVFWLLRIWM